MPLPTLLYAIPLATVLVGWIAFALVFVLRRRAPGGAVGKRNGASLVGILFVMAGFMAVGSLGRRPLTPIVPMPLALQAAAALAVLLLVPASLWLTWAAVRALGKQWSVQARVLDGHALITTGPYRLVRHPIYTAVIGLVIAMGLAYSSLAGLTIGLVLVTAGTLIRVRSEDRLLRERFGAEHAAYARRVPPLVPYRRPLLTPAPSRPPDFP